MYYTLYINGHPACVTPFLWEFPIGCTYDNLKVMEIWQEHVQKKYKGATVEIREGRCIKGMLRRESC